MKMNLDKTLADKLDKEYREFCQRLMKEDKEKIMKSAYEITVKEKMKNEIKNMNLYNAEKEMMIAQDDLLNEFYHDWLDCDTPLGDSLKESIEESVAVLTRYNKRNTLKINSRER